MTSDGEPSHLLPTRRYTVSVLPRTDSATHKVRTYRAQSVTVLTVDVKIILDVSGIYENTRVVVYYLWPLEYVFTT